MKNRKLYQEIASTIVARENCDNSGNTELYKGWTSHLRDLQQDLPSGSGLDHGTTIDCDKSTGSKLVFYTSYHHINEGGGYEEWTQHTVVVTPSFDGFDLKISGRNRNDIKEYIHQTFEENLNESAPSIAPVK